jgi:hypothetical protein
MRRMSPIQFRCEYALPFFAEVNPLITGDPDRERNCYTFSPKSCRHFLAYAASEGTIHTKFCPDCGSRVE